MARNSGTLLVWLGELEWFGFRVWFFEVPALLVDDEFEVEVAALDCLSYGGLAGLVLFGSSAHSVGVDSVAVEGAGAAFGQFR